MWEYTVDIRWWLMGLGLAVLILGFYGDKHDLL